MSHNFDDMEKAEQDPYWAKFEEDGFKLEEDDEVVAEHDGALVGALTGINENAGTDNNSTVYTVQLKEYDRPVKFWGSAHIDSQIRDAPIDVGTVVGVKFTGDTRPTGNEQDMQLFDVRYLK